jgi:hypothetical protein
MAHKVRCDISFQNMDEYLKMKGHLDNAGLKFDGFVSYSLNYVWNLMLEEYARELRKEEADALELASTQPSGDTEEVPLGEGHSPEASSDGQAVSP